MYHPCCQTDVPCVGNIPFRCDLRAKAASFWYDCLVRAFLIQWSCLGLSRGVTYRMVTAYVWHLKLIDDGKPGLAARF